MPDQILTGLVGSITAAQAILGPIKLVDRRQPHLPVS